MNNIIKTLEAKGLDAAIKAAKDHPKELRLFAVKCVREVQHLLKDKRSFDALDVSERYAKGEANDKELKEASQAAWLAWNHMGAAITTGRQRVRIAARAAACAAWEADRCGWMAAEDSAWASAFAVEREPDKPRKRQEEIFRDIFKDIYGGGE
jgi:hypothetical protein